MSKRKATLVGIAGSFNAMSLSVYNLKAYALLTDPALHADWDIHILQQKLITPGSQAADQMLAQTVDLIVKSKPDLVGFSVYMWNVNVFKSIAETLRHALPDARIVMGGPEIASDYIREGKYDDFEADFLVYGEGEATFRDLLRHLSGTIPAAENIPGLAFRKSASSGFTLNPPRPLFTSLQVLPSPYLSGMVDDEVLARPKLEANLETQRGCTLKCTYCIYHKDMPKITYNDVDRVIEEAKFVNHKHGVKKIRFVDANFTSDLPFAKQVMRGLIDARIEAQLMFELIPGFIDEEIADLFQEFNGLFEWNDITIGCGVQTINYDILKSVRRGIKLDRFVRTFDLLSTRKIFTKIDLIIGLPGEDFRSITATLEYFLDQLRNSGSHLLCCHVMRGLPGTELIEQAKKHQMVFSSEREPHELIESPILPRPLMLRCLRRTATVFRLVNHDGWTRRNFLKGSTTGETSLRDEFFEARDRIGSKNIELVDILIDKLMGHLSPKSWFVQSDFPFAETWWWGYAQREVKDSWLLDALRSTTPEDLAVVRARDEAQLAHLPALHDPRRLQIVDVADSDACHGLH
jgi:radical SAM superfamily enzyme YgiQ (UPF0313 family)